MNEMRALPLWQPWATLVAEMEKMAETRAYPASKLGLAIGDQIAIHAAKTDEMMHLCRTDPFAEVLSRHGYRTTLQGEGTPLPRGGIVAVATLFEVQEVDDAYRTHVKVDHAQEFAFGNYDIGRYAWHLTDIVKLRRPIGVRGHQGAFRLPADVTAQVRAQLP